MVSGQALRYGRGRHDILRDRNVCLHFRKTVATLFSGGMSTSNNHSSTHVCAQPHGLPLSVPLPPKTQAVLIPRDTLRVRRGDARSFQLYHERRHVDG